MKYQSSHKMKCRLPLMGSKKKERQVAAMESELKRHQDMRRKDERDHKIDLNEVMKQEDCTPETWRRIRIKVIYKKEMWKMPEITFRFTLCKRCTNCSQHSCTTDFTTGLTVDNQRTREGVGVHTKRWIILQHTDCLNRNARSGVSKCGSPQWTSRHLTQ